LGKRIKEKSNIYKSFINIANCIIIQLINYQMQLFFIAHITDNIAYLTEEEATHCVRVLRHKVGDELTFMDGKGGFYTGKLIQADPKKCALSILTSKQAYGLRSQHLHVAIAPTKNMDRLEWFVEKAVEIGVEEISLIATNRTERSVVKIERLEKIILAAAKQSVKAYLPMINPLVKLKDFLKQDFEGGKFIAHLADDHRKSFQDEMLKTDKNLILIGPEGDFTLPEIESAFASHFVPVTLGASRLRTETAGMYACAVASLLH
jgi:16S rRNA (uracil1498-N3)-methyltransferase